MTEKQVDDMTDEEFEELFAPKSMEFLLREKVQRGDQRAKDLRAKLGEMGLDLRGLRFERAQMRNEMVLLNVAAKNIPCGNCTGGVIRASKLIDGEIQDDECWWCFGTGFIPQVERHLDMS